MNFLLTGAAGFIASKVAEQLLAGGHTVAGVDNLNDAYDVRLKQWRLSRLKNLEGFTFFPLDIRDLAAMRLMFDKPRPNAAPPYDAVINLAARAGVPQSVEDPWIYYETNVTGTLNLLTLCKDFGVKKFLLASTSSLYGNSAAQPFREDSPTDAPLSPYSASKKAAELTCHAFHHLYSIDVSVVRYFTVYGPAGRPEMSLFRFVQRITEGRTITVTGNGKQSRDFTYVEDIARGTIAAAMRSVGYEAFNLGSDKPIVLMDAIHMIESLVGKKAQITYVPSHPSDVPASWADISKAGAMLDWRPRQNIEGGLRALIEWYQANREWASLVKTD